MKILYLRLSKEDEKNCESESIINQKIILAYFINNKDLKLIFIRIDVRYSNSDFEYPVFKKIIKGIENNKIITTNLIVAYEYKTIQITFNYMNNNMLLTEMEKYLKYAI